MAINWPKIYIERLAWKIGTKMIFRGFDTSDSELNLYHGITIELDQNFKINPIGGNDSLT